MVDLTTEYLGLKLKNPLVPSASPLSRSVESARALEDAGAAALVMYSLFEEDLRGDAMDMERSLIDHAIAQAAAAGMSARNFRYRSGLDLYLEQIAALKSSLEIPVIASLNGVDMTDWVAAGRQLEQAGADALELNVYYIAADAAQTPESIEGRFIYLLNSLRAAVSLPITMKVSPYFCALPSFLQKLEANGAGAVVLFNRFFQPDIDLDTLSLSDQHLLSGPSERLLAMRWISLLYGRTGLKLAASGGVFTWQDSVKMLLSGADVVHMTSALLQYGPSRLSETLAGIRTWMEEKQFATLDAFRGRLSQQAAADTSALTREGYVMLLDNYATRSEDA